MSAWWPGCSEYALTEVPEEPSFAQPSLKVLLAVAHPDDESECAGMLYRIVHELNGVVDQVVVTSGEGGRRYCAPALEYYGLPTQRGIAKQLPRLRRKEVRRAGRIIGIRHHFFLEQKDNGFTLDPGDGFRSWNLPWLRRQMQCLMRREKYDLVLTLLPSQDTHGHHKTVALLVLEAAAAMSGRDRPAVAGVRSGTERRLGIEPRAGTESAWRFDELPDFPLTRTTTQAPAWAFDRHTPLAGNPALDHSIVVHWVIAEHKSQGLFQMEYGRNTHEFFWLFEVGRERHEDLWNRLAVPSQRPVREAA